MPLTWFAALALVVAVIGALALLFTERRAVEKSEAYGASRRAVDTVAAPVSSVVAAPGRWAGAVGDFVGSYFDAANENRRLKAKILELERVRDEAIILRNTNARYERLMGLRTEPPIEMVAAHTISDSRGPFANSRLADAGSDKKIEIGNPVMNDRGLIGRVVGVGPNVSRILLLTDVSSRTPVMIERTNARAILVGDGGPNPKLAFLRSREPLKEGDLILSSGDGGVFPRGLPVGVVVRGLDGSWRVALAADNAPMDFIKVLLFRDFGQLTNPASITATEMPTVATEDPRSRALVGQGTPTTAIATPAPPPSPRPPATAARPTPGATPGAAPSPTAPAPKPKAAPRPKPAPPPPPPAPPPIDLMPPT